MAARPCSLPLALALCLSACASWKAEYRRSKAQAPHARGSVPVLAGKRCADGICRCRGAGDPAEKSGPAVGFKRIEIRMSAANGRVALDSPSAGHFEQTGPQEACFYVDLEVGVTHDFHLDSQEEQENGGVVPHVHLAEYGPAGPYWYDIFDITCGAGTSSCDLESAREWGASWLQYRKRGRLDACGSITVSGVKWTTSGGADAHKGGALRDFEADFSLEVRKFATQFPPGASECQIKL